jgi:copper chaperone CopZ
MKNFIISIVIIAVAGLIGFSVLKKQTTTKPKFEVETNQQQQENLRQATLKIDGMFCVSCATGAEYALKEKEGVIDASVDYDNENGKVIYDPLKISKDDIIQAVNPYTATVTEDVLYK